MKLSKIPTLSFLSSRLAFNGKFKFSYCLGFLGYVPEKLITPPKLDAVDSDVRHNVKNITNDSFLPNCISSGFRE